ncbi:hypothetical protein ACSBR1_030363 [Camellia fascicularis]
MWSNIAFISTDDDCWSSMGSNTILSSPLKDKNKSRSIAMHNVTEEELKLREELAKEIEKELEREIMEGILVLVRRLTDLKAKQITRGLKNFHLDEFLGELYGSNSCTLCKIGGHVSPRHMSQQSPPRNVYEEDLDMESTTEKWSYRRKELERWLSM